LNSSTNVARRPRGRRPGTSGTRDAIASAASRQFAELGYDRATIRSIADEAGVDPALVSHFFGSKQQLFVAAVGLPFDPAEVLPGLIADDPATAGLRFARFLAGALEERAVRDRLVGLVRAAASEPEASRMVRDLVSTEVMSRLADALGVEDADVRANLVGSQVVGLVMARHIVRVEPLASLPAERVAAAIAPNLQRYLTGPLPA
jgi:AcrR family transcriptional regulator